MRHRLVAMLLFLLVWVPAEAQPPHATEQIRILVTPLYERLAADIERLVASGLPGVSAAVTVYHGPLPDMAQAVAEGGYDVVLAGHSGSLREVLMPLDPLLARTGIYAQVLDATRVDGAVYGLPVSLDVDVIIYNKELLDRYGLPHPRADWTWDDMLYAINVLRSVDSGVKHGFVAEPTQIETLWSEIVYLSGDEPQYAADATLRYALEAALRLRLSEPVAHASLLSLAREFRLEEAPMQWVRFGDIQRQFYYDETGALFRLPFEWGVVPMPRLPGGPAVNRLTSPPAVGITAFTFNPATAWEVALLLANEVALLEGYSDGPPALDTRVEALNRWIDRALPFISQTERDELLALFSLEVVSARAATEQARDHRVFMADQLRLVTAGYITPDTALAAVIDHREELLASVQ